MTIPRLLALTVAVLAALAAPAEAQVYSMCAVSTPCKFWYGTATTNSSGQWSVTIPAGTFTTAPIVIAKPASADNTMTNSADTSVTAPIASSGAWTVGGIVTLPATVQALGGAPVKAAGAGMVVMVETVGY